MRGETLEPLVYLTTKLRSLDGKLTLDQAKRLVALPRELGFANAEEFLAAFRKAVGADASTSASEANSPSPSVTEDPSDSGASNASVDDAAEPVQDPEVSGLSSSDVPTAQHEDEADDASLDETQPSESTEVTEASITSPQSDDSGSEATDDDLHARVKSLVESGKTRAVIANELGISITRVQKIRKSLGLGRSSGTAKSGGKSGSARRRSEK